MKNREITTPSLGRGIGQILSNYHIPYCSTSAGSPRFSDKVKYPFFWRALLPASGYMYRLLLNTWNVRRVSIVFQGDGELGFSSARVIRKALLEGGIDVVAMLSLKHDVDEHSIGGVSVALQRTHTRYVILSGINDFITKAVYKLGTSGLLTDEMVFMSENALHINGDPTEVYGPDFYDVIRGFIWLPTSPNTVEEPALNVYEYINREVAHAEIPYDYFDEYYMPEAYDCAMMMLLGFKKLLEKNPEVSPKLLGERQFQEKMNWTLFKDLNYSGLTWSDMKLDSKGDLEMPILVSRYTGNYMNRTSFALSDLGFTRFLEYNTSNPIFHNDAAIPPPDGPIISSRSYASDTFEGAFIIALTSTGAVISVASIAFFIAFRHDNIAKSASIPECVACLSGCCIGYLSLLFFLGTPTTVACKARVALISTAFGVVVSCLASRSLFIAVIFSTRQVYKNSKALNITHRRFKYCNLLVVALELALVAAWGYFSKVRVRSIETNTIFYEVCVEAVEKGLSMSFMSAALFVYNILIYVALLCSLYLQKDVGPDRSDELTALVITSLIVPIALIIISGLDNTVSPDADFRGAPLKA
ncbi:periplasmic binding protein-like I [Chytriomyces cf. hyalinus JEL632]|nr:periplasmic binding protein-like I [Chytriomyces cf. hyalinus JEL632]